MHVVITIVWLTTRPLESSLLRRRNYQITFELFMLQMNSLITNHIDVDCQVATRAGRWIVHILPLEYSYISSERQWSTVPFTSVSPLDSLYVW